MHDEGPFLTDLFGEVEEIFDEVEVSEEDQYEDVAEDPTVTPNYLLTAILAGLYELPPPHILRKQTGWGRRIRYDPSKLVRLEPSIEKIATLSLLNNHQRIHDSKQTEKGELCKHQQDATIWCSENMCGEPNNHQPGVPRSSADILVLERMVLQKYFFPNQKATVATSVADFCVYRVKIQNPAQMNEQLRTVALQEQSNSPDGIDVSNAGGAWHGKPHFLDNKACSRLHHICTAAIQAIEDRQARPVGLQLEAKDIECWANISKNESWNRLHTHEGCIWSGVYYVQAGNSSTNYGGRLVLKPTAHPREDTHKLTQVEKERFYNGSTTTDNPMDANGCEYLEIDAVAGHMIIFPGWLHHCVLPLDHLEDSGRRISIAFNVNEANRS